MQYAVEVNGRVRQVVVRRQGRQLIVALDGRAWTVDAVPVAARGLSLLITEYPEVRLKADTTGGSVVSGFSRTPGEADRTPSAVSRFGRTFSHDVTVAGDVVSGQMNVHIGAVVVPVTLNGRRHSGRKEEGGHSGSGPQRLLAPMPGKVVRVLVNKGDPVRARQPLAVIEAMKMENELRAGRDGVVAELPVSPGQSVEAGTLIAVIVGTTPSQPA
jgi:biotin carboxyl carrier protein